MYGCAVPVLSIVHYVIFSETIVLLPIKYMALINNHPVINDGDCDYFFFFAAMCPV